MATVSLSPIGNGFQFLTAGGLPLSGGLLWTYLAGTTTPATTYTTNAGNVANANPIVLGPDGRPPSEIWLVIGQAYKFILLDSLSNPVGTTLDNIQGINDSGNLTVFGNLSVTGNSTFGDAGTDSVTVNAGTVSLANAPTISGAAIWSDAQDLSAGASFGDTSPADPGTLNYYKKDTFTPSLKFGGEATGLTYTSRAGKYVRIGDCVFFNIGINLLNKGSSTGAATISGLPFPAANADATQQQVVQLFMSSANFTVAGFAEGTIANGSTDITLMVQLSGSSAAFLTDGAFANPTNMSISGAYLV